MMTTFSKQIHLGAHFPGVNNTTVWSDPQSGSQIEFSSFQHFARTAERGKFDFIFLAEGLRLREQGGHIYDLDVVGRPDNVSILSALAAVTDKIGVAATVNSTYNEPYEVARQFATLNILSGQRAAWNVVTSWDAFTGENFRRGGYLPESQRYVRAKEFLDAVMTIIDSYPQSSVIADKTSGQYHTEVSGIPAPFNIQAQQFSLTGNFAFPAGSALKPVIFQAGDSSEGREFAAAKADAIFSRHSTIEAAKSFYTDVKSRLASYGRAPNDLLIMPSSTFILSDTDAEAQEKSHYVALQQFSGQTAIKLLEQVWNADLSQYDPDGPLPEIDPVISETHIAQGRASVRRHEDIIVLAKKWRALAEAKHYSIRELMINVYGTHNFVGSPSTIAQGLQDYVNSDACDGFIIVPYLIPGGLDEFVDKVIPILQERGAYRSDYTGSTLREHLGLHAL